MSLISAESMTQFFKLVKAELKKAEGKTITNTTYRNDEMTIHFADHTHLRIGAGIYGVHMEALFR